MKSLFFLCLVFGLSVSSLFAIDGKTDLTSKVWTTAVASLVTILRNTANTVPPEEPNARNALDESIDADSSQYLVQPSVEEDNPASSNEYFHEVVMPTIDNNCALFAIYYGQNDFLERRNILMRLFLECSECSEIRRLMAIEIFGFLMETGDVAAQISALDQILTNVVVEDKLRNLIIQKLREFHDPDAALSSDQSRRLLLSAFERIKIIGGYLENVILRRIGPHCTGPYPALAFQLGEHPNGGMGGMLAAIAAMEGVNLKIYQRDERGVVSLIASYRRQSNLQPARGEARTVHLLHTRADGVFDGSNAHNNHFNLLLPVDTLLRGGHVVSLNGIPFDDERFAREIALPAMDAEGRSMFFRMYGRGDLRHEEVIGNLKLKLNAGDELSAEIKHLIAVEILTFLLKDEDKNQLKNQLYAIFRKNKNNKNLSDSILAQMRGVMKASLDDNNLKELLGILGQKEVIEAYLDNVIVGRPGASGACLYPSFRFQLGDPIRDTGMTGVLAAIAAMDGVNLKVYNRDESRRIFLVAAYDLPENLRSMPGEVETIHLLQTTVDNGRPGSRNHFNLLEPISPFRSRVNRQIGDIENVAAVSSLQCRQNFPDGEEKNLPIYCLLLPSSKLNAWAQKFGFCVQYKKLSDTLCETDVQSNPEYSQDFPFALLDGSLADLEGAPLLEGFRFVDFPEEGRVALAEDWEALLQQQEELLTVIANSIEGTTSELSQVAWQSVTLSLFLNESNRMRNRCFGALKTFKSIKPSLRNLQLILLAFVNHLKAIYQEYRDPQKMGIILERIYNELGLNPQKAQESLEQEKLYIKAQVEELFKKDIVWIRYFLNQVIHLCYSYDYKPILPNYFETLGVLTDEDLQSTLESLFTRMSPRAEVTSAKKKAKKKKKAKIAQGSQLRDDLALIASQPIVDEADSGHTNPNIIIREGSQSREEELEGANGIKIEKIEKDRSFDFQSKKSIEGPIANATTGTLIEHFNENDAYHWDPVASERYRQEKIGQVVNTRTSGQEIVLTPEERAAFHEYLNEHAKKDLIGHFESLLGATNRSLTQPEMNQLASQIEPYLRSFLLSRRHPDNSFVFTWETLDRFVKEFVSKDRASSHNFHPSEGKRASLPKSWLEHKRTHWISLGLMPAIVGNRSTFAAQNNYQRALVRRYLSEMKKEGKTDSENKKKSSKKDKKSKK